MNETSGHDPNTTLAEPLKKADVPQLSLLRLHLRQQWQRGQRVSVEECLRQQPDLQGNDEAILDLIYSEFVLREELGEKPCAEEYVQRFPHYRERLQRLLLLDQALQACPEDLWSTLPAGQTQPYPPAPEKPPPVQTIGKYLIVGILGKGGQGVVYRALHPTLGKEVVIKATLPLAANREDQRHLLQQEGRLLAEMEHPYLARIYDLDFHEDRAFLVMEYVPGLNLEQAVQQQKLSPLESAALLAKVARALAVAHQRGIIHHDIKPGNIVIDSQGQPRLIDFGLAKVKSAWSETTETPGTVSGTVQFMAPEQARGETDKIGPAVDLFALGGVLYYLLTGQPPFSGSDILAVLERARRCEFDDTALNAVQAPRRLKALCLRLLAANPAKRPGRADDVAVELERITRQPKPPLLFAAAAALLLVLVASGLLWWLMTGPSSEPQKKLPEEAKPVVAKASEEKPVLVKHPSLFVRVEDGKRYLDLISLRTKDHFKVRAEVPAGVYASLFLISQDGKPQLLTETSAVSIGTSLHFPAQETEAAHLTPPAGSELLLVCGRRSGRIGLDDLPSVLKESPPWPVMLAPARLRLQTDQVVLEEKARGALTVPAGPDPVDAMQRRLEALRLALTGRFEYFEGLAFAHVD